VVDTEEDLDGKDLDMEYYNPDATKCLAPGVKRFMETAFSKCIPKEKRKWLASE
jgi:hypothetical protein